MGKTNGSDSTRGQAWARSISNAALRRLPKRKWTTLGDGAFLGGDVSFLGEVQRQVFGVLGFDDGFIFFKNLVVEVERVLYPIYRKALCGR